MPVGEDTAQEFQKRRAETWAASKPWLLLMAIGVIIGSFVGDLNDQSPTQNLVLWLAVFAFCGGSIVRLTYIVRAHYRCPVCGKVPMSGSTFLGSGSFGYERGVDLNPRLCQACGAKLK